MRDDSADILLQFFFFFFSLREAIAGSSGMNRDVHSMTLPIQHFSVDHGFASPPRCSEGIWRDSKQHCIRVTLCLKKEQHCRNPFCCFSNRGRKSHRDCVHKPNLCQKAPLPI